MIAGWFESGFDLWMTPTMGEAPTQLGAFDDSGPEPLRAIHRGVQTGAFTAILNATGQPAMSVPLGTDSTGMPTGAQFVLVLTAGGAFAATAIAGGYVSDRLRRRKMLVARSAKLHRR